MLSLTHEVGGEELGVGGLVRDNQNLAGTGDHVYIYGAEQELLCRCDKDISGADDFIDLRHGLCAVCESSDCLSAAHEEHSVNTCELRGGDDIRIGSTVLLGRSNHDKLLNTRELGGDSVHQNGRRKHGGAARNVNSDALQTAHTLTHDNAVRLCCEPALLNLSAVEVGDVVSRFFEGFKQLGVAELYDIIYFFRRDLGVLGSLAVEFHGILANRLISVLADVLKNLGHNGNYIPVGILSSLFEGFYKSVLLYAVSLYCGNHWVTASSFFCNASISFLRSLRLAVLAIRRAEISVTQSMTSKPFAFRVEPVSTISTMPSASPTSGASSTEPSIFIIRTSMFLSSKNARVTFGYLVAIVLVL